MVKRLLKIIVIMSIILTMTMANFIFVGSSFISYAADSISTNNANIEFDAYFKNEQGQAIKELETTEDEQILYFNVNVKREGYFNGQISLKDSNFTLENTENEYVNKIEGNVIYLNQINAGTNAEIGIKVKVLKNENFNLDLLEKNSQLEITGIYRDSTEKDKEIKSTREVRLKISESNNQENVLNTVEVITNKVMKINGEEKRVVQLLLNMGLKNNNFPIKSITNKVNVPVIEEKEPEILEYVSLNNMKKYDLKNENGNIEITLENEAENNEVNWKKSGNESIILTYLYEKDVDLSDIEIKSEQKITLYNQKELQAEEAKVILDNEEKDKTVEISTRNNENEIYKGKLYSNIDREYTSTSTLKVNLGNVAEYVNIKEQNNFMVNDQIIDANIVYLSTTLKKSEFDEIFGQNGNIQIINEAGEVLAKIDSTTQANENGEIVIDYDTEAKNIQIKTSTPVKEGTINFVHKKSIKQNDKDILKSVNKISTNVSAEYNQYSENEKAKQKLYSIGTKVENNATIQLNETKTEARLEINKDTLSTVVANDLQIKAIMRTNTEEFDLYEEPVLTINLPEEVENINITSLDLVYENEMKIKNYEVNGRTIVIYLEGKQTQYKEQSIEGATIVINAEITVNKKSATADKAITMEYTNKNVNTYIDGATIGTVSQNIKVVAPKDVTTINSIKELGVETIGQEEKQSINMKKAEEQKELEVQVEVINNNAEAIRDVNILGTFPTNSDQNNLNINLLEGINMENAKIYYSENENATEDLQNPDNLWTESLPESGNAKKYLIQCENIESGESIYGTYKIQVPRNLEYNQKATEGYEVSYTNTLSNISNKLSSTKIEMDTGVGPKVETKLSAKLGSNNLDANAKVKNGEVIKYQVEVSNTGSENVDNIVVSGKIPEGTTLVEPQENYEYTGASYYKEVDAEKFEKAIGNLKVGEKVTVEYEVKVKANTPDNTNIANMVETKYGEAINESNEITNSSESGNLSVSVKRVTDRSVNLYNSGVVQYYVIVENISDQKQENVKVHTNLPNNLEVARLQLVTGLPKDEVNDDEINKPDSQNANTPKQLDENQVEPQTVNSETIEYKDEINIGTLEPGENKVLSYDMVIKKTDNEKIEFSAIAQDSTKKYLSNVWEDIINNFNITMTMTSNTQDKYIKAGDIVEYTVVLKNDTDARAEGIVFTDSIPKQLTINKITVDGEEIEKPAGNDIEITLEVMEEGQCEIKIETVVNYSDARDEAEAITNKAYAKMYGEVLAETPDLSHIIEANDTNGNGSNGNNDDNTSGDVNDGENGNIAQGTQMISGAAWYDENKNGIKDNQEKALKDVKVKLLNAQTNKLVKDKSGKNIEATTNDQGMYVLNDIANGKYVAIFEYNTSQYALTKYKVEGADESLNSDAMLTKLTIDDQVQEVAGTDIITIDNNNISDMNIGLMELQVFDLKLDKYVSKMIVQNSDGTKVNEFNNETLAKIELDAKKLAGTTVIIEYKINVTNNGEVEGYAKKVVDYLPNDLKFSSELNKDWYQSDGVLYNTSLANEKISAGETKTLTLTLTKTMNENNTGRINNMAEIAESYNDLGLVDINSTPGNKQQGENDMNYADVIISIRTGGIVYVTIFIAIIAVLGVVAYIVIRKRKKINKEEI